MPSLVSHKLSIIKYVVLKKIFFFLCFDRLIWTWTWTWTRTSLDSDLTRTRTSLDLDLTRTRTSLDLDLSWTRQRWTWLQPYKEAVARNPFTKEEVYNCDDELLSGQLNVGFSKVCEIFKVCGIESFKYVWEFYTLVLLVCYRCNISTPWHVTLNETNCDWLFDMLVKWSHGRALANENCHGFQTFSRQSQVKSSWALLSFRYMVHTVEQNAVPHRTMVLHKYRHTAMK